MLLTVLSVALGTAYISGSLILTQSLEESFASIVDSGVDGIDVGLVGSANSPHGVPLSVVSELATPTFGRLTSLVTVRERPPELGGPGKVRWSSQVPTAAPSRQAPQGHTHSPPTLLTPTWGGRPSLWKAQSPAKHMKLC